MNDQRKTSDILLDIEEKLLKLTQTVAANDFNNKLILSKIDGFLGSPKEKSSISIPKIEKQPEIKVLLKEVEKKEIKETEITNKQVSKIPVSQRVVDNKGKDLFMADVFITNDTNELVAKIKTNAVGKWQTYLPVGKFFVKVSKKDTASMKELTSEQIVEITSDMKALQLPNQIIERA